MGAKSMTGFGAAERATERGNAQVELRAVNHRFLDVQLAMPSFLNPREAELRGRVARVVKRARLDVRILWDSRRDDRHQVTVDAELLRELYRALEKVRGDEGIPGEVGIDVLTRYTEVVRIESAVAAIDDAAFGDVIACLDEALEALNRARTTEGEALVRDISGRVGRLSELVTAAEASSAADPERIEERLRERVGQLLGDGKLDPARLHQEVAYLAERADVSEELTRLRAHIERARELEQAEEIGKPLDFLVQEMGREANTLGAKSRATDTTGHVLAMKAEIEKIREQARNLE